MVVGAHYRRWLSKNPRPGVFGGGQLVGRGAEYAAFKRTDAFPTFEAVARAMTLVQRTGAGATTEPDTQIEPSDCAAELALW